MKKRNPFLVFLFPFITFFIYEIYWTVKANREMNDKFNDGWNPHAILPILVPFYSYYWFFKNGERLGGHGVMLLLVSLFLSPLVGMAVMQHLMNKQA